MGSAQIRSSRTFRQKQFPSSKSMVELIDVFPTLNELADLEPPQQLQGTSLVPLLENPNRQHSKDYAYSVVSRRDNLGYAVRNQNWRYGKWPSGEELYDLQADPHERHNVADAPEYHKHLAHFRTVLTAKQKIARSNRHASNN